MNHSTFEDFANKKALQYCTGDQRHQVIAVLVKGGKVVNFGYSQAKIALTFTQVCMQNKT